ncbi:ORF103 [Plodia interpunctella granulovirus]|uniref:ORF103 n=1 Tax=Plodia interpunctella granulovirus TaxID=262175 RepID=A0A1L5JH93_9BBAC|nr:ORF103 [Plodia interpunctella granulovirus]APO13988.1 ORF103 [Plodia interpunctella granulovirus]
MKDILHSFSLPRQLYADLFFSLLPDYDDVTLREYQFVPTGFCEDCLKQYFYPVHMMYRVELRDLYCPICCNALFCNDDNWY